MKWFRILLLIPLALMALGCGSGTPSQGAGELGDNTSNPGDPTDPSTLPLTGQATYTGFLSLNLPNGTRAGAPRAAFTGDMTLFFDFEAVGPQVSGFADDFLTPENESVTGQLYIEDGTIARDADVTTDYTFSAGISGSLSGPTFRSSLITGDIEGDFRGDAQEAITGVMFGDVTTALGFDVVDGAFSVLKN